MYYAQLNENDICIGVSQLGGEVDEVCLVAIESYDETLLGKRYNVETGEFEEVSQPDPDPTLPQPTLEEQVAQLREDNLILMDALATTFEEILMLREELAGGVD